MYELIIDEDTGAENIKDTETKVIYTEISEMCKLLNTSLYKNKQLKDIIEYLKLVCMSNLSQQDYYEVIQHLKEMVKE